MINGTNFGAI
jgi:hypothetical protein